MLLPKLRGLARFHLQSPLDLHLVDVSATVDNVSQAFLLVDCRWNGLGRAIALFLLLVVGVFLFFWLVGLVENH